MVFSGLLQHENKDTWEKWFGSKYFLAYCFINLLVNYLLHTAPYAIYRWHNVVEKMYTASIFRSIFAVTIEVNKYNEAKGSSGICCTVVSDHTRQVSNFCDNFTHSTTPIKRVCSETLWPSCGHGVKSTFLLGLPNEFKFCYTRNMNMKQLKYCFIFPPFLSNFAEFDAENWLFCTNFRPCWPI